MQTWAVQAVVSLTLSLLAHPVLLALIAAMVIALKVPDAPATRTLKRSAARAVSLHSTRLHIHSVFLEACRSPPRVTREHYTEPRFFKAVAWHAAATS
jgi:uncharacterized protein (DUF58 family)